MERLTDVVYRIQASPRSKPYTVNRFRLWKVSGRLPEDWWSTPHHPTADPEPLDSANSPDTGPEDAEGPNQPENVDEEDPDVNPDPFSGVPTRTRAGREVKRPRRYFR